MSENNKNNNPLLEAIEMGGKAAHAVKGAAKTGKMIAGTAKGAAAGGPYGAIAAFAWENRKIIAKAIAAMCLVLAIPILFIVMLPGLIFGDLSSTAVSDVMNNDSAIIANIGQVEKTINDCINSAHDNIIEKIHKAIKKQPSGTKSRITDHFTGTVIFDTNNIIAKYCASKNNWNKININDLKEVINRNKYKLFTYIVTQSSEKIDDKTVTVYTYTVQYTGDETLETFFKLDDKQTRLAYSYSENLITYLYGSNLVNGTAAISSAVEKYSEKITLYAEKYGIDGYTALIKSVMMAESGGMGSDVMQCSECPYNTKYPQKPNSITDIDYSIEIGIKYLAECLKESKCASPTDMTGVSLALQGYNFGNGYITWAIEKYNGYSQANAIEFSNIMKAKLGWTSYGNPNYVSSVLKYYLDTSSTGGGQVGWGSPFPGKDWKSVVTSEFGYRTDPITGKQGAYHSGIDIGMPSGTTICAVHEGTVETVNYHTVGYGYHLKINHGDGHRTLYAHCSSILVKEGDKVTTGQAIARVGSTGKSTGPHLHLTVYVKGEAQNPRSYIK